jgi:hypothetical protein
LQPVLNITAQLAARTINSFAVFFISLVNLPC